MIHDRTRARDYDGLVHLVAPYPGRLYRCSTAADLSYDLAMHGVWQHEPTTCLLCIVDRRYR